jgi:hypothetical protein
VKAAAICLQLAGLGLEIAGILAMANGLLGAVTQGRTIRLLASALRRGDMARGAVLIEHLSPEDRLASLRGLALIGRGFVAQAAGVVLQLFG